MERKWKLALNDGGEGDLPTKLEPLGFAKGITAEREAQNAVAKAGNNTQELKKKRAMDIAFGPFKGLLQTGFMMWMSGSAINIFSIMIIGMIVMNMVKSFLNVNKAFASLDDGVIDLSQPKLVYLAGNVINAAMALYKLGNMGLLPTTSADWTWLLPVKQHLEASAYIHPW